MSTVVYYAHPLSLYNTPQEDRDVATLQTLGFEVLNPNATVHEAGYKAQGMDYFKAIISRCQVLAFRAFADGSIPAGIVKEIAFARDLGLPVIELPSAMMRRALSVDATRETLCELGYR